MDAEMHLHLALGCSYIIAINAWVIVLIARLHLYVQVQLGRCEEAAGGCVIPVVPLTRIHRGLDVFASCFCASGVHICIRKSVYYLHVCTKSTVKKNKKVLFCQTALRVFSLLPLQLSHAANRRPQHPVTRWGFYIRTPHDLFMGLRGIMVNTLLEYSFEWERGAVWGKPPL
ncbi:hypothetical protein GDO78_004193 [Eleutherodactylus coqui]|uniref:Uncharacterized protein n=1 Tax=Eleutherodactylus coqui TaxID=57060 RepID=A0A8J6JZY7_ELECQ|nr:hypothetical protein GDO78_004193 [Eleutherodactylus coqui]